MSKLTVVEPMGKPWQSMNTPEKVENLHGRLGEVEEVFQVANKTWKYLKFTMPGLIVALLASMNQESAGYKALEAFAKFFGWIA
jgi:hypothetical protein